MTSYINHFRPIYEVRAVVFWFGALLLLPFSGMPYAWAYAIIALVLLAGRMLQVSKALKFRMSISTKWLTRLEVTDLLKIQKKMLEEKDSMYLGTGFEWTQKHTQIAHDIRNQYTMAYYPTNTAHDGTFRTVSVQVIPPRGAGKLTVRTRTGYYAQKSASGD